MTTEDRSFVIRLVCCVGAFIVVAVVGGFFTARLMGLPVDVDKFYAFLGPPFFTIINALIIAFGKSEKKEE